MEPPSDLNSLTIYFKKIINAPVVERSFNFCGDITYCCHNDNIQHAEICFSGDNSTFLASIDYNIGQTQRDYNFFDNEGYWIGYTLFFRREEWKRIKSFCENCKEATTYDFYSLYFAFMPWFGFLCKKPKTHSCASLCFNALIQSEYFREIMLEMGFNQSEIIKISHHANPNILYRILRKVEKNAKYKHFIEKTKIEYIWSHEYLHSNDQKYIISSDDYFSDVLSQAEFQS